MRWRTTGVVLAVACGAALHGGHDTTAATSQASSQASSPARLPVGGLATVFEPGLFLKDRNEDDRIDDVEGRIVLPDRPAPGEVAGAAALAARLGLETSGLSFPLASSAAEARTLAGVPRIIVGLDNALLDQAARARLAELEPGEGLVVWRDGTIVVGGADAAGTQRAAEAFAARSPYLWEIIGREQGETFERIASDVVAHLADGGVTAQSVRFDELRYPAEGPGVSRGTVVVGVDDIAAARDRLAELVARHARGVDTDTLSYSAVTALRVVLDAGARRAEVVVPRAGMPQRLLTPPRRPPSRFERPGSSSTEPEGRAGRQFDLADVFETNTGVLADTDDDRIPDDVRTMIVVPALPPAPDSLDSLDALEAPDSPASPVEPDFPSPGPAVARIAARLGLESTGLTFPLLGTDLDLEDPDAERRPLILTGRANRWGDRLDRLGKLRGGDLPAGVGRLEAVPDAFGGNSALVVTGGDPSGEAAAADYLARRLPRVWATGAGEPALEDVREAVRRTLEGRTTAAQAALAVAELDDVLDQILDDVDGTPLERLDIAAYLEETSPAFDRWVRARVEERVPDTTVDVTSRRRLDPVEVFSETPELIWEVDDFWQRFRERVVPAMRPGAEVSVDLRVSESPEQRADLAATIEAAIIDAGGSPGTVRVLSAYKQGLSWLMDDVTRRLRTLPVATVTIGWRPVAVDTSQGWRFYNEPTRWLNELYPSDDVMADALGLPLEAFTFVAEPDGDEVYAVEARDASGMVLLRDGFSPAVYERAHLERFPKTRVDVTTGWIRVVSNGEALIDERLPTDLDRIWDHYQGSTLDRVHEHVRETTGGAPTSDKAPFFHTLRVEIEASEPDFMLGVDQEHVSSLESLHDSVYFDTLDFFYEVVEAAADDDAVAPRSLAAGNILPWVHPERRGQAPTVSIRYSGFASKEPKLVVRYETSGNEAETITRTLEPVELPEPYIHLAEVESGADELARVGLVVRLDETEPLPRLTTLLDNLSTLHEAGIDDPALGFANVREVAIRVEAPGAARTRIYATRAVPDASPAPTPHRGGRLVTWENVIGPDESERIAHTLGTTPNVTTYVAGRSYQGRPVSVMEIHLPMEADLVSQAKMAAWKPVLSIVGRQHANEVSSTSHILRLAELLATDSEYQRYLRAMNVVIQPVVNPDGAALAYELQKLTPTHCLHAGRYSALGPDVPGQADDPDTLVTEALVLSKISDRWIPDVRLNPHGYPSHEWVQHFANYNPKSFRSYWIPRGWYTSARAPEHPQLAAYRDVALEMQERIAAEVSRDPEVRETNARIYDRYRRWAIRWQPHVYRLEVRDGTAIYSTRRSGTVRRPTGRPTPLAFSGGTEAMDETAQGPWLDLVTRMGFGYLMASVTFLDDAEYDLYRLEEERQGRVHIALIRPRPVRPGGASGRR